MSDAISSDEPRTTDGNDAITQAESQRNDDETLTASSSKEEVNEKVGSSDSTDASVAAAAPAQEEMTSAAATTTTTTTSQEADQAEPATIASIADKNEGSIRNGAQEGSTSQVVQDDAANQSDSRPSDAAAAAPTPASAAGSREATVSPSTTAHSSPVPASATAVAQQPPKKFSAVSINRKFLGAKAGSPASGASSGTGATTASPPPSSLSGLASLVGSLGAKSSNNSAGGGAAGSGVGSLSLSSLGRTGSSSPSPAAVPSATAGLVGGGLSERRSGSPAIKPAMSSPANADGSAAASPAAATQQPSSSSSLLGRLVARSGGGGTPPPGTSTASGGSLQLGSMSSMASSSAQRRAPAPARPVWKTVPHASAQPPPSNARVARDFPTALEVIEGQRKSYMQAQAAAQAKAAHERAIIQGLDSFRGHARDPNQHYWDEEDEDNEFGEVLDFGDGTTYTIPAAAAASAEREQPKYDPESFDRSWPPRDAKAPVSGDRVGGLGGVPPPPGNRSLFGERPAGTPPPSSTTPDERGFIAAAGRPRPTKERLSLGTFMALDRETSSANEPPSRPEARTESRPLPPHLQNRPLPPHLDQQPRAALQLSGFDPSPAMPAAPPPPTHRAPQFPPPPPPTSGGPSWADRRPPPHILRQQNAEQQQHQQQAQPTMSSAPPLRRPSEAGPRPARPEPEAAATATGAPAPSESSRPTQDAAPAQEEVPDQQTEMHSAAERARLRRQQEEAEREAQRERARQKAKELEERLAAAAAAAAAASSEPPKPQPSAILQRTKLASPEVAKAEPTDTAPPAKTAEPKTEQHPRLNVRPELLEVNSWRKSASNSTPSAPAPPGLAPTESKQQAHEAAPPRDHLDDLMARVKSAIASAPPTHEPRTILTRPWAPDDFDSSRPPPPTSPGPSYKDLPTHRSPTVPRTKPIVMRGATSSSRPRPTPRGWLLSWEPAMEQLNPRTLSRDEWLFGTNYHKGQLVTVVKVPRGRLQPAEKPTNAGALPPPPTKIVVKLPSANRKPAVVETTPSASPQQPSAPASAPTPTPAPEPTPSSARTKTRKLPEGAVVAFAHPHTGSFSEEADAKAAVRFMVSSELEGKDLLDEINNTRLEEVTGEVEPIPAPTPPEWARPLTEQDRIKNVWSQPASETPSLQQSNSLIGLADDFPAISVQELRDEQDTRGPHHEPEPDSPRYPSISGPASSSESKDALFPSPYDNRYMSPQPYASPHATTAGLINGNGGVWVPLQTNAYAQPNYLKSPVAPHPNHNKYDPQAHYSHPTGPLDSPALAHSRPQANYGGSYLPTSATQQHFRDPFGRFQPPQNVAAAYGAATAAAAGGPGGMQQTFSSPSQLGGQMRYGRNAATNGVHQQQQQQRSRPW